MSLQTSVLIKTEYYNLDVETYSGAFPKSAVRGGALARIGDRYLRLSGDGHLYVFGLGRDGADFPRSRHCRIGFPSMATSLPLQPDARGQISPAGGSPGRSRERRPVLHSEWFRTYGLLVQETGSDVRVFVSHGYWQSAQQCWVERVSMLELDRAAFLRGAVGPEWKTLYETTPCLPVRGEGRRQGIPFVGYFGGGRMAMLDAQTLLLTVGDFGFDGVASFEAQAQNPATSYGKTIAINIADGQRSALHAWPPESRGLFIDRSGTIWSTEHGPQGGDELNQLERGKNYGWPYATYGTDYGSFSWPLNNPEAEQVYQTPVFAWVPSIGVSNLLAVEGALFSAMARRSVDRFA